MSASLLGSLGGKMGPAETEGARRATGVSADGPVEPGPVAAPDPEVAEKAKRRRFSAEYKQRILQEAARCGDRPGEIGALLRREGLYSSHLVSWRRQRDEGTRAGLRGRKRGRKALPPVDPRVRALERENARLRRRLDEAETLIAFQKKVSELLGIPLKRPDRAEND